MHAIMKLLICCVFMLFLVNVVPAEGSTIKHLSCCFEQLGNGSVVYILNNTVESNFTQWTRNKTPIKDEHGNVDKSYVLGYGQNWITLIKSYLDIEFWFQTYDMMKNQEVQCTDLCELGSFNLLIEERHETNQSDGGTGLNTAWMAGIGVSVFIFIVIGGMIGWKQCYREL